MGSQRKKVPNIFLDSNIYIAAALSNRGGSFRILQEAKNDTVKIYTSAFVMQEIARTIKRKYPQKLEYTTALISSTPLQFKKQPGVKEVQKLSSLIEDPNDAPILAAALKNKVTYLVTLDRKHFFTPKLQNANLPFKILTPKDFLQNHLH